MGAICEVQTPGAAVGWIGPALDEPGVGEAIDHATDCDGFHIKRLGQSCLVDAFGPRKHEHDLPLRPADTKATGACIETAAQKPRRIGDKNAKAVSHRMHITSLLIISKTVDEAFAATIALPALARLAAPR